VRREGYEDYRPNAAQGGKQYMNTNNNPTPQDAQVIDETMIAEIMRELEGNNDPDAALAILKRYRNKQVSPETYLELLKKVLVVQSRENQTLEEKIGKIEIVELPLKRTAETVAQEAKR
jgi:hypothetical protein